MKLEKKPALGSRLLLSLTLAAIWLFPAYVFAKNNLPDAAKIEEISPFLIFLVSLYFLLILTGLINLLKCLFNKLSGRPALAVRFNKPENFLNQKKAVKVILFLPVLFFLAFILQAGISSLNIATPVYTVLGANLLLQVGAIYLALKLVGFSFFNFSLDKSELEFSLYIYTLILPLLIAAFLVTIFLFNLFNLEIIPQIEKIIPFAGKPISLFVLGIQIILLAPLAEELIFRGIFYSLLRKKYSFLLSASLISLFFSLVHRTLTGALALFVISFAICYIYEKTKKISAAILIHSFHNLLSFLIFLNFRIS